jgi:hypothetical protein
VGLVKQLGSPGLLMWLRARWVPGSTFVGVPAKVRTIHGRTSRAISQEFREAPNALAREEPAATTQRLGTADIWPFVVPLSSHLPSLVL